LTYSYSFTIIDIREYVFYYLQLVYGIFINSSIKIWEHKFKCARIGWEGQAHFPYCFFFKNPRRFARPASVEAKGQKGRGWGEGIFALLRFKLERFRFSLIKRNTKQINFIFLLKEKIAREKIKKCRENLSVLVRRSEAEASGNAPHYSGFSLKKVRISFSVRSTLVRCSLDRDA